MQDRYLAVNVFDEGNSSSQQTPEQQQPSTQTPSTQNETKANPPASTEQKTTQPTQSTTTDSNLQQNGMTTYIPWISAGLVAITILLALFAILKRLNKK